MFALKYLTALLVAFGVAVSAAPAGTETANQNCHLNYVLISRQKNEHVITTVATSTAIVHNLAYVMYLCCFDKADRYVRVANARSTCCLTADLSVDLF